MISSAAGTCRRCLLSAINRRGQYFVTKGYSTTPLDSLATEDALKAGSSTGGSMVSQINAEDGVENFDQWGGELERRKRKADSKLRRKSGYVSSMIVTVRGGKGGPGSAAFAGSRSGGLGPPSGGDGGPGSSIYLTTSPHLTDLSAVKKRIIGAPGGNGAGNWKHGRKAPDTIITVPVGTIVREIGREGDMERWNRDLEGLGLPLEERRKRWRERWFVKHPGGEVSDEDYYHAADLLKREHILPGTNRGSASGSPIPDPGQGTGSYASRPDYTTLGSSTSAAPIFLDIAAPMTKPFLLSKGGKGGLGNPHFHVPSSSFPARLASRGSQPDTLTLELELKLLADVGLVGFPNAGKSTILRALTGRKAEVAGYSFTTLNPQVGVVRVWEDGTWGSGEVGVIEESEVERARERAVWESGDFVPEPKRGRSKQSPLGTESEDQGILTREYAREAEGSGFGLGPDPRPRGKVEKVRFTISDNPGLLPQASENVGLGHTFLRHLERCLIHVYVLDITRPDPLQDLKVLQGEMEAWKSGLSEQDAVIILNKADAVNEQEGKQKHAAVLAEVDGSVEVLVGSAKWGLLETLVQVVSNKIQAKRTVVDSD